MPVLSAAALPALGWRITRTRGSADGLGDVGGAVGRPVVDHDDLDRVVIGEQGGERVGDAGALVVGRHDDRDRVR